MNLDVEISKALREAKIGTLQLAPAVEALTDDNLKNVVARMSETNSGCVMIRDETGIAGIFTERDLLLKVVGTDTDSPISGFMSGRPRTLSPDETLESAVRIMSEKGYRHLPIVDDSGGCVGVLTAKQVLDFVVEFFPKEVYNLPPEHGRVFGSEEGG